MPYITVMQTPKTHQLTLDEILKGEVNIEELCSPNQKKITGTVTRYVKTIGSEVVRKADIPSMISVLASFNVRHKALLEEDPHRHYRHFPIPKKSGGLRWINAPDEQLMYAQRQLMDILRDRMYALYHTAAFAYTKGRCPLDAVRRHQANASNWFLKTDFSDFFGSTTPAFVLEMLGMIFPFSEVMKDERGKKELSQALDLCFLDGGLPQGTPISPMLTNLMMIPIDHYLSHILREKGFVYTRYADDILISHRYEFCPEEKVKEIDEVLAKFNAPFKIKPSKTRYGSKAGQNWNLGLMLNKDNQITVGWQNKKRFKAMCTNYLADRKAGVAWELSDIMTLRGLISYYKMVEKDYIEHVIKKINEKFHVNLIHMIRADIKNGTKGQSTNGG